MSNKNKKDILLAVLSCVVIALSAIIHAFGTHLFVVPNNFAPSGLNGIATMVQYKTGFSIGYMSLLINIPLCIFAFFTVGKGFAVKSFVFCGTYSVAYLIIQNLGLEEFRYCANGHDTIFPVLLSGVLLGAVYGICMRLSGSTGGTDIVSKYISKLKPELNFFWINFSINAVVAAISFFVYAKEGDSGMIYDYKPVCLCIVYCFVTSFVGNQILLGTRRACKFTVITAHGEKITKEITTQLKHGVTKIEAVGTFTNDGKDMLICVINRHQITDFQKILKKYDNTFSFCETVEETFGNFRRVKKIL